MRGGGISFKQTSIGSRLLAALLAVMRITAPLTTLLRKEPPPKGKPRKDGELKQTAIGSHSLAALLAGVWITTHPSPPCFARSPPQGEAAKRRRIETDLSRLTLVRHSPQRGKQGTAALLPIKKSSPRKLRIRGEGEKAGIISLLLPFVQGVPLLYRGAPAGTRCPQSAQGR